VVERLAREGFVRARVDGEMVELAANTRIKLDPKARHSIDVIVDRLVIDEKIRVRLSDSVETALKWGEGRLLLLHQPPKRRPPRTGPRHCTRTAIYSRPQVEFRDAHAQHFSFNAPAGACQVCHGLGQKMVFDETLVVPDQAKSLDGGAVLPWRRGASG